MLTDTIILVVYCMTIIALVPRLCQKKLRNQERARSMTFPALSELQSSWSDREICFDLHKSFPSPSFRLSENKMFWIPGLKLSGWMMASNDIFSLLIFSSPLLPRHQHTHSRHQSTPNRAVGTGIAWTQPHNRTDRAIDDNRLISVCVCVCVCVRARKKRSLLYCCGGNRNDDEPWRWGL